MPERWHVRIAGSRQCTVVVVAGAVACGHAARLIELPKYKHGRINREQSAAEVLKVVYLIYRQNTAEDRHIVDQAGP